MTSERLRALRAATGLSQRDFAARLGISRSSMALMETGDRPIVDRTVISIANEFGASRDWLETGDGEMFDSSDARITVALEDILLGEDDVGKALLKTIATFSDEEWALLKRMIERFVKEYGVQSDD